MKDKTKKISIPVLLLIIISIFFSLKKTYKLYDDRKKIDSATMITSGYITDYYEIGLANYYLKYHYTVDGDIYNNEVIPDRLYKKCEDDHWCINKRIFIKYYRKDPSISIPILDSISN